MRILIEYYPESYPACLTKGIFAPIFVKLSRAQNYKRNVRSSEYMRDLAIEKFGNQLTFLEPSQLSSEAISMADEIVLLWPDGNGYGWGRIEKNLFQNKKSTANVLVLNGRRRSFIYSKKTRTGYLIRRTLERLWLGEILFSIFFIFISPIFLVLDLIHGKR